MAPDPERRLTRLGIARPARPVDAAPRPEVTAPPPAEPMPDAAVPHTTGRSAVADGVSASAPPATGHRRAPGAEISDAVPPRAPATASAGHRHTREAAVTDAVPSDGPTALVDVPPMPTLWQATTPKAAGAPAGVLLAAAVAGLAAAIAVPLDRPGIGWLLAGLASAAAVFTVIRGKLFAPQGIARFVRPGWTFLALALLAVGTLRAAGWLFALCVIGAGVAGSFAMTDPRSVRELLSNTVAVPVAALRSPYWLSSGTTALRQHEGGRPARLAVSVLVGALLVVVFGALFTGADATFAGIVAHALPNIQGGSTFQWVVAFGVGGLGVAGACRLVLVPATDAGTTGRRATIVRRIEWAVPVGLLVALFAAFVADQVAVLFGGAGYVLRTADLTYAQYARSGFWQLSMVTALTLAVISGASRLAARATPADRAWLRGLLGSLAVLTLVIVASALDRMWSYQRAYGFTVQRLLVETAELWMGVVYLLVIAAGARMSGRWLPRAVAASGLAALLVLGLLDPERLIAGQNVVRWQETGRIDRSYLSELSQDAVPALAPLPGPLRGCVLFLMADRIGPDTDGWNEWNASRASAAPTLAEAAKSVSVNC